MALSFDPLRDGVLFVEPNGHLSRNSDWTGSATLHIDVPSLLEFPRGSRIDRSSWLWEGFNLHLTYRGLSPSSSIPKPAIRGHRTSANIHDLTILESAVPSCPRLTNRPSDLRMMHSDMLTIAFRRRSPPQILARTTRTKPCGGYVAASTAITLVCRGYLREGLDLDWEQPGPVNQMVPRTRCIWNSSPRTNGHGLRSLIPGASPDDLDLSQLMRGKAP
ncbi:hypothetical protein FPV67DRAFT_989162 [Lyophyllum atratum]|nr:hypothetical protein FPV67DRAFT_989162 [Lyophyllum atratum]